MSKVDFFLKQINFKLKDKPLFYICNDPERALGLEALLKNYHIVCVDDSDLFTYIKLQIGNIFSLENHVGQKNALFRSSAKLLEEESVAEYINNNSKQNERFFQTFKISSRFQKLAERYNATLLNTTSQLNKSFENKLRQYRLLKQYEVNFPPTLISKLKELDYQTLADKLGNSLVIQFDRGHTGTGTVFINSIDEFKSIQQKFPDREARVASRVEGFSYTVNAAVSRNGIYVAGLSYQITGVPELTHLEGGTVGNDFSCRQGISSKLKQQIIEEVTKVGFAMKEAGYKGLFGVDLIVSSDQVYIIEVNARQPASVPFHAKLQLRQDEVPLSIIHIMEFMDLIYDIDPIEYCNKGLEPVSAGQLFLRNVTPERFIVNGKIKTGVYRLQSDNSALIFKEHGTEVKTNTIFLDEEKDKPLIFQKEGYSIDSIEDGGFLIASQLQGKQVNQGNEIARIQALQSLVGKDGKPFPWAIEALQAIYEYLR